MSHYYLFNRGKFAQPFRRKCNKQHFQITANIINLELMLYFLFILYFTFSFPYGLIYLQLMRVFFPFGL